MWLVSLTRPMLTLFLCREFLLHIVCWLRFNLGSFSYASRAGFFCYRGSFSYTSRAGFIFISGVCLTHPALPSIFMREFLWRIPCWLRFFLFLFLSGKFLLHIPCWLHFCLGSFSYTSRDYYYYYFYFYFYFLNRGSFSYTSLTG